MQNLIRLTLSSGLFILLIFSPSSLSQTEEKNSLAHKLQNSFNNKLESDLSNIFSKEIFKDIEKKYTYFSNIFPDAKWIIKPSNEPKDKRQSIDIMIIGKKDTGVHKYSLISNQRIAIKTENNKITSTEILSDYSILQSGTNKIEMTVRIPDTVLTGSKYDVDIILDKPLENTIIAGGLIAVDKKYFDIGKHKNITLKPIASGGLFKSVRAPLEPGKQRWSALIAHPDGLISVTKMVRVISDPDNL